MTVARHPLFRLAAGAALVLAAATGAMAQQANANAMGLYLQYGQAPHGRGDTDALTLGVTGPMFAERDVGGLRLYGYWDAYVSRWQAPHPSGGDRDYTQIGLVPTVRWVFDQGRSPWFMDAALGLTYLGDDYETTTRSFGSRFNFTERVGLGLAFGERKQHELSVSVQHFSNAGIKKPNPGENFWQLRYAVRF